MKSHFSINQSARLSSEFVNQIKYSSDFLAMTSSVMIVTTQAIWNKISHSKTLTLWLIASLLMIGTVVWNQASDYYTSLALTILQNQRTAQENRQVIENELQLWQKAASLQPESDILNSKIKTLLPSPN